MKDYDCDLQMFRENPPVKMETMRLWRWMVEAGRKGHGIQGPSVGQFAPVAADAEISLSEITKPAVKLPSPPAAKWPGYTGRTG